MPFLLFLSNDPRLRDIDALLAGIGLSLEVALFDSGTSVDDVLASIIDTLTGSLRGP